MYLKFWGTRGSIPTPVTSAQIKAKIRQALLGATGVNLDDKQAVERYLQRLPLPVQGTAGGDTTCLEVRCGEQLLIVDAGSGLRSLGLQLMQNGFAAGSRQADFLITHTHWDHIQGFPFFTPAFIPGNRFTFYSPFADLENRLARQQHETYFPVSTDYMRADFTFQTIAPQQWNRVGRFKVYPLRLSHPGVTFGYRIEADDICIVFASDAEYKRVAPQHVKNYLEFFKDADLLIFDAQYTWPEALDKPDWGHSSAITGAEMAWRAGVKRLALVHHDPTSPDEKIWAAAAQAESYLSHRPAARQPCKVMVAYDGLTLEI